MMKELHEGPSKGHFVIKITQKNIRCWILVANYVQKHA